MQEMIFPRSLQRRNFFTSSQDIDNSAWAWPVSPLAPQWLAQWSPVLLRCTCRLTLQCSLPRSALHRQRLSAVLLQAVV